MPVFAALTALALLDSLGLRGESTRYLCDSRSVLRPTCPAQGITADAARLGPLAATTLATLPREARVLAGRMGARGATALLGVGTLILQFTARQWTACTEG